MKPNEKDQNSFNKDLVDKNDHESGGKNYENRVNKFLQLFLEMCKIRFYSQERTFLDLVLEIFASKIF